jgi:hypothetical protein
LKAIYFINAADYNDENYFAEIVTKGKAIEDKTIALEKEILGCGE